MGFSREEYWSGLLFPSPADDLDLGIEPISPALQDSLPPNHQGSPLCQVLHTNPWYFITFYCPVNDNHLIKKVSPRWVLLKWFFLVSLFCPVSDFVYIPSEMCLLFSGNNLTVFSIWFLAASYKIIKPFPSYFHNTPGFHEDCFTSVHIEGHKEMN